MHDSYPSRHVAKRRMQDEGAIVIGRPGIEEDMRRMHVAPAMVSGSPGAGT